MRIIVFFDLPMTSSKRVKDYNRFRKFLIKEGFIMLQQSVYTKLALNATTANRTKKKVGKNLPPDGLVQMLTVTEKQFASMETLTGNAASGILDSTDRLVIL